MNWKEVYKQKICTAKEAVSHIHSGDRVVVAHACARTGRSHRCNDRSS
ncbi:MAG: hypothetical protein ACLUD0_06210 [Eubacterium ramulus]